MSYRLQENEDLPDAIRRIALEQIDKAIERSRRKDENRTTAIHDIRVCCKKIRAILRLVRAELERDLFDEENKFYRDAGRRLAPLRNRAAMNEAYSGLIKHYAHEIERRRFARLREPLQLRKTPGQDNEATAALAEVGTSLRTARRRIRQWPLHTLSLDAVEHGLGKTYKRGRSAFAAAYDNHTVESFHEWRKLVKYLGYQVGILRPVWPPVMKELAHQLKTLGDHLSDDHDLALLRSRIPEKAEGFGHEGEDFEALKGLIDLRRKQLEGQAKELADRIYVEKRGELVRRIRASWQAWHPPHPPSPAD